MEHYARRTAYHRVLRRDGGVCAAGGADAWYENGELPVIGAGGLHSPKDSVGGVLSLAGSNFSVGRELATYTG